MEQVSVWCLGDTGFGFRLSGLGFGIRVYTTALSARILVVIAVFNSHRYWLLLGRARTRFTNQSARWTRGGPAKGGITWDSGLGKGGSRGGRGGGSRRCGRRGEEQGEGLRRERRGQRRGKSRKQTRAGVCMQSETDRNRHKGRGASRHSFAGAVEKLVAMQRRKYAQRCAKSAASFRRPSREEECGTELWNAPSPWMRFAPRLRSRRHLHPRRFSRRQN
jgi:hypothetical protein